MLLQSSKFISHTQVNAADNSLLELTFSPTETAAGTYYMHILIGNGKNAVEIAESPFACTITKSEL